MVYTLLLCLLAMIGGYSLLVSSQSGLGIREVNSIRAYYLAGSTLQSYMRLMADEYYKRMVYLEPDKYNPLTVTLPGAGTVELKRQTVSDVIRCEAKTMVDKVEKTVTAELENNDVIIDKYFMEKPQPDADFYMDELPIVKWEVK